MLDFFENEIGEALYRDRRVVIHGVPGVGKTVTCLDYCKNRKFDYLYINCEYDGEIIERLSELNDDENFNEKLIEICSFEANTNFENACFIFDNIECSKEFCERLYPLLKKRPCLLMMTMRVINNTAEPVLKETKRVIQRPLSFMEFLKLTSSFEYDRIVEGHMSASAPFPELVINNITEEYDNYLRTGGMPEAVKCYGSDENYDEKIHSIHDAGYVHVVEKTLEYSDLTDTQKNKCRQILDSVIYQMLNTSYNKYVITHIRDGATIKNFKKELDFLVENNILIKVDQIDHEKNHLLLFYDCGIICTKLLQLSNKNRDYSHGSRIEYILRKHFLYSELISSRIFPGFWRSNYTAVADAKFSVEGEELACFLLTDNKMRRSVEVYSKDHPESLNILLYNGNLVINEKNIFLPEFSISCIRHYLRH